MLYGRETVLMVTSTFLRFLSEPGRILKPLRGPERRKSNMDSARKRNTNICPLWLISGANVAGPVLLLYVRAVFCVFFLWILDIRGILY